MLSRAQIVATAALVASVAVSGSASAAIGDWAMGTKARLRLLAARVEDGRLSGAIEIVLPAGWETYWRYPGNSGIAPSFDFAASRNLGTPDIAYPVPQRVDDGFSITNVYTGRVVLPLTALVPNPAAPIDLTVNADLGVCEKVCIPDHIVARLRVPAGESDPVASTTIAAASRLVPGPAQSGIIAVDNARRTGGTDRQPTYEVTITAPDAARAVVFVEGPKDWFPDAARLLSGSGDRATFGLTVDRMTAKTPLQGASFRVTIAAGGRAVEQTVPLN